jgi:hypothetical protein
MNSIYLRAFVAGSSFPATIIPLLYMGIATTLTPEAGFHYFYEVLSICVLFGLLNVLFNSIKEALPFPEVWKYWFFGWCHGLFFTMLGNFWLHVPEKLFHLSGMTQYLTIPVAIILYACIWRFLVRPMNYIVGIEK